MIVVIGVPALVDAPSGAAAGGLAGRVATEGARAGGTVQLAGRVGDDAEGDRLILALAAAGVGHAAVLRDPARRTPVQAAVSQAPARDDGTSDTGLGPDAADLELLAAVRSLADGSVPTDDTTGEPVAPPPAGQDRPALDAADVELALRYLVDYRVLVVATPLDDAAARVVAESAAYAGAQVIALATGVAPPATLGPATVLDVPADDPDGAFAALVARFAVALASGTPVEAAFRGALDGGGWEAVPT